MRLSGWRGEASALASAKAKPRRRRAVRPVVAVVAILVGSVASSEPPASNSSRASRETGSCAGITVPHRTATLASVHPARIEKILVEEGRTVHEGELVVALDESVQSLRTGIAQAAAETPLEIDLARERWSKAKRDFDRLTRLHGEDFASSKELSDALAESEISRLEYELAHFNQEQASRTYERERASLEEFRIRSPFTGFVVTHLKHAGEAVDQLEGIVTLVQLDPIQVQVDAPISLAPALVAGQLFQVTPGDPQWQPRVGKVHFCSPVADGASQTFKVKLVVENADAKWTAGLKVGVDFDHPLPESAAADSAPSGGVPRQDGDAGPVPKSNDDRG